MMFWYGNGMSGWGYALMTVGTVLFWGLIIVGVVALFRYAGRTPQSPPQSLNTHRPTPEQLLAERSHEGRSTRTTTSGSSTRCAGKPSPRPRREDPVIAGVKGAV